MPEKPVAPAGKSESPRETNTTGMPLTIPPGFSISIFAKGLGAPRDMFIEPMANVVFVSVPSAGKILDGNGKILGQIGAQAKGEWVTADLVPFEGTLEFKNPETDAGTLVVEKDNPSGMPQHAREVRIPIRFR